MIEKDERGGEKVGRMLVGRRVGRKGNKKVRYIKERKW
jgi:hypothetical protein